MGTPMMRSSPSPSPFEADRRQYRNSIVLRDFDDNLSVLDLQPIDSCSHDHTFSIKRGEQLARRVDHTSNNLIPPSSAGLDSPSTRSDIQQAERDGMYQTAMGTRGQTRPVTITTQLYMYEPNTLGPVVERLARSKRRTQSERYELSSSEGGASVDETAFHTLSSATSRRISFYETATEGTMTPRDNVAFESGAVPPADHVSMDEGVMLDFGKDDIVKAIVVPLQQQEESSSGAWTDWLAFPWTASLTRWIMSMMPSLMTGDGAQQERGRNISMIYFDDSGIGRRVIGRARYN